MFVILALAFSACFVKRVQLVNSQLEQFEKVQEEQLDKFIHDNEDYKALALLCGDTGNAANLVLSRRSVSMHEPPATFYYYQSAQPYGKVSSSISTYLEGLGWESIENLSVNETLAFQKDNVRIILQHGGMGEVDYGLTCLKKNAGDR